MYVDFASIFMRVLSFLKGRNPLTAYLFYCLESQDNLILWPYNYFSVLDCLMLNAHFYAGNSCMLIFAFILYFKKKVLSLMFCFRGRFNEVCCPQHPEAHLIEDYRAGDQICSECGLVVGDRWVGCWIVFYFIFLWFCLVVEHKIVFR